MNSISRFDLALDLSIAGFVASTRSAQATTRTFGLGPAAYLGPAAIVHFGKLWWARGVYARITDPSHDLQPGEPYDQSTPAR